MNNNKFTQALKRRARARIALIGPAGSGKTYSALAIGERLAKRCGGRMAVIDTERGSASLYADRFDFDVLELISFSAANYIEAIEAAAADYAVVVIDSLSHAWMGRDGALEQVDRAAARTQGNSYAAWRTVTPMHNRLVDTIISARCHVIATMRAKTEYVVEKSTEGKTSIRKIGLAPVMRDGIEYEFTVVGDIDQDHRLIITKTRCGIFTDVVIDKPGDDFANSIYDWLMDGVVVLSPLKTPIDPVEQPVPPTPPPVDKPPMHPHYQRMQAFAAALAIHRGITDNVDACAQQRRDLYALWTAMVADLVDANGYFMTADKMDTDTFNDRYDDFVVRAMDNYDIEEDTTDGSATDTVA